MSMHSGFNLSARYHDLTEAGRPFWHQDADRPMPPRSVHAGQGAEGDHARPFSSGAEGRALYVPRPTAPTTMIHDTHVRQHPPQEAFRSTAVAQQSFLDSAAAATGIVYHGDSPGLEPRQRPGGGRDHVGNFQEDFRPTSSVVDGNNPTEMKSGVQHDNKAGDFSGCRAEQRYAPDSDGIVRGPYRQQELPAAATGAASCEFAGCSKTPRYGTQGGPLNACQVHKRKGMHSTRDGALFVATRDGSAFRQAASDPTGEANDVAASSASTPTMRNGAQEPLVSTAVHDSTPSEGANRSPPKKPRVIIRKKCEVTGCDVHPSYGDLGTWRARFCSAHREEHHVKVKNRPCQFPGCGTRPHYGFSGGRNDFCVAHKKEGMVHLRNEVKSQKNKEAKRKRSEVGDTGKEGGSAGTSTHGENKEEERRSEDGDTKRKAKFPATGKTTGSCSQGVAVADTEKDSPKKRSQTWTRSSPRALAPYRMKGGLAPSDEMKLLQEARESARAAAEASGSGRRARVPSRKFLEASGRMVDKSAQWMTKEMREEQGRIKRELKEQRKAAAAAGLKVGEVIEAIAVPSIPGAGGVRSEGSAIGGVAAASKVSWRKLTPAETLRAVGIQSAVVEKTALNAVDSEATAAEMEDGVAVDKEEMKEACAPTAAAAAAPAIATPTDNVSERKRKFAESPGEPAAPQGSARDDMAYASCTKPNRKEHGGVQDAGDSKRAVKAKCNFESCSKKASFGVNGVVRYCKMHRIFGMHKIVEFK